MSRQGSQGSRTLGQSQLGCLSLPRSFPPASERVRGGKQAAVQKAGVECFVLHFLSRHLAVSSFLFPCMGHSCSTDLFPLHVVKQK